MKFLCDVHISYQIVNYLKSLGFDTIHVNEILNGCFTKDNEICKYADLNDLIVITKDADFRNSFFINKTPKKIIKINLGNISNKELIRIISNNIKEIQKLNSLATFLVEVDEDNITFIK